ncbi:MAG: hypothetical protein ASARMPRED_006005 [Alectoria sarmentosa]|nr:MAG: hypothetical protein ASARMPRED_006005 [Alectoria sarmentosa]
MHLSAPTALAALVLLVAPTTAHSWVEEVDVIDPKTGSFTGTPGYCRNNTFRSVPGFSDPLMVHILPSAGQPAIEERDVIPALDTTGIFPNDTMCKRTQQAQYQSNGSPRLRASPGDLVALRYQENGHVTLPQNQPGKQSNRGTVSIYGTTQPKSPELFLDVFGQWNTNATGGDQRGRLLARQDFDDNYCYQINQGHISTMRQAQYPHTPNQLMGANLWCQNNIALPTDIPTGSPYVLYWVWDWPTEPGVDPNLPKGKAEIYTTCLDIDIVAKPGRKRRVKARQAPSPPPSSASQSALDHLNSAAIPAYVSSLTASPAPAGASPAVSAPASPASPESTITPSVGAPVVANPTNPAEQVADDGSMTNAGVASYIEKAVSAAIVAEAPKVPLTVTLDIVESVISPMAAATAVATQPAAAPAPTPVVSPTSMAPAANQAASPAPSSTPPAASISTPAQAPAAAPSSMPPKSLDINPPILSASPSTSTSVSQPGFSGTATPVEAPPAVAATSLSTVGAAENSPIPVIASGATANSTSPVMASGASQNGTVAAKGQRGCTATTCKSKRQSKIFGPKSGGQRI